MTDAWEHPEVIKRRKTIFNAKEFLKLIAGYTNHLANLAFAYEKNC